MTFGESLRHARTVHGMTLRCFARNVGISPAYCSDIELGRRFPGQNVLATMKVVLKSHARLLEEFPVCPTCHRRLPASKALQ